MTTLSDNGDRPGLGIALMLAGIAAFAVMDATIKWLTADFPVTQVVALRSWFGLPLLCLLAYFEGGLPALKTRRPLVHVGRYALVLVLSFSFFWALSQMKLVDAVAITFAVPILIAALSMPLLKEPVGWHRWAAIGTGFCGVLIILRPGLGVFQWAALVVLGSAVVYALLMITTRAFKSTESTAALMLYPQLGISLTGIVIAPLFWVTPGPVDLGLFALGRPVRQYRRDMSDPRLPPGAGSHRLAVRILRADLGHAAGFFAVARTARHPHHWPAPAS